MVLRRGYIDDGCISSYHRFPMADHDNDRPVATNPEQTTRPVAPLRPAGVPPVSRNALPMGTRLDEFEIVGLIGEGGFGIVYLAQDHSLDRKVALKEYLPSSIAAREPDMKVTVLTSAYAEPFGAGLRSFINEAKLLARFDHPFLVKVYRFWEENNTAYMVMPLYEGLTLKRALTEMGEPPKEKWLKDLLRCLLDALDMMHRERCFHRDIAPDNILIQPDGKPVLLDFGAARQVINDMTQALTVILKPGYAPIEQYAESDTMKQGAWTDIYALAAVIHFAISGLRPVPSINRMMADTTLPLTQIAADRYSMKFLTGIDKALSVMPQSRPQNIDSLRKLIGLDESGTSAKSRASRKRWYLGAGAAAALFAVLAAGIAMKSPAPTPQPQTTENPAPALTVTPAAAAGTADTMEKPKPIKATARSKQDHERCAEILAAISRGESVTPAEEAILRSCQ